MAWAEGELYVLSLHCNNKLTVIFREKEEAEFPAKKKKGKILSISLRITNEKCTETLAQNWRK